jgi:membrane glycosyltransferase
MHELRNNADLLDAHLRNLSVKPRHRGQIDPHLAIARAKIEDAESFDNARGYLSPREIFAVLNSRAILEALLELPALESKGGLEAIQLNR